MDNRKLTAHTARNTVVSLHLEDPGIPNSIIARMELMINDQDLAAELVKRWNAYPELITALDDLMYELKARDENYDMRETYGRADRLLKSIDPDLGDSND